MCPQKRAEPKLTKPDCTNAHDFSSGQKKKRDRNQSKSAGTCFSNDFNQKDTKITIVTRQSLLYTPVVIRINIWHTGSHHTVRRYTVLR